VIWLKSALVGFAAALLTIAAIVAIVAAKALWSVNFNEGSGGIGFVTVGIFDVTVLPVIIAFALGFWWTLRRDRRKRSLPSA
jgi:uncharacterized BrkB/YihY/UPF0761 family membrane protein